MSNKPIAYIIMEATMEPTKPEIVKSVNAPNMFYVTFKSCLQSFDCFNRNKRNYALNAMTEAIKADHIRELIAKGTWTGENGHPDSTDIKRILSIDPTKICHRICDVEFRGKLLYGTIETLNDDIWGKQFSKHILQGLEASFSLRALAAIQKLPDGRGIIKTKPHIVTYDRVVLPSHREAYMETDKPVRLTYSGGITESASLESFNTLEDNTIYIPKGNTFEDSTKIIEESSIPSALSYIKDESRRFKELATFFDANCEKVTLVSESAVMIQDEMKNKIVINLEDYITKSISGCFRNISRLL
ncbi:MAG: S80 family phage morphogenetic serine protease [Candidatus Onthovivens sp.]|nr:S80 family phage morphogenetic serine protease [Candidatus Onthovivens sp.]